MEMPLYKHDCAQCVFLGWYQYGLDRYDLYWCPQSTIPTVIARLSSVGGDYTSGLEMGMHLAGVLTMWDHPLAEAYRRAVARNLGVS